jgi:hypothetical protein
MTLLFAVSYIYHWLKLIRGGVNYRFSISSLSFVLQSFSESIPVIITVVIKLILIFIVSSSLFSRK